jgi:hypothetical protein
LKGFYMGSSDSVVEGYQRSGVHYFYDPERIEADIRLSLDGITQQEAEEYARRMTNEGWTLVETNRIDVIASVRRIS